MSYILDALRKADAQRERDPARGIHAQPVRAVGGATPVPERYRAGWWAATAALVVALAWAGWQLATGGGAAPPAPEPGVAASPPPTPAAAAPQPAGAVLPPPVVVAAPPAPKPEPLQEAARRPRPPVDAVADRVPAQRVPTAAAPAAAAPAGAAPAIAPANVPPVAAAAPAAPADAAAPVAGLPADAPKVAISGGVYSTSAAQRMLIVNGQVLNEGSEVSPGLVLEEIRPRAAVLRFRGSRYLVGY
jgi:general secretion pathway protein B